MFQTPIQIAARGIALNDWWKDRIIRKAWKFEELYGRVTSCRVVVEAPHKHHHKGRQYQVRIDVCVPRGVIVTRECDPFLNAAIERAFDAADRALRDRHREGRAASLRCG